MKGEQFSLVDGAVRLFDFASRRSQDGCKVRLTLSSTAQVISDLAFLKVHDVGYIAALKKENDTYI
jgi:hypothetical protein